MIQDKEPRINSSVMARSVIISFNTYRGEVPMSPKMIPNAITRPAAETLLIFLLTQRGLVRLMLELFNKCSRKINPLKKLALDYERRLRNKRQENKRQEARNKR